MDKILNKPYYIKTGNIFCLYHPIHEMEGDQTSHNLPYFTEEKIMGQYSSLEELQTRSVELYGEKAEEKIK
jgi:hypothetical protein